MADKNLDKLESWRLPWFGGKSKTRGARAAKGAQAQAEAPGGVPADAVDPRRRSTSSSSRPTSYANVASGLEGRDAEETAALARVAAKDDDVNAGLKGIDDLLDSLGQQAPPGARRRPFSNLRGAESPRAFRTRPEHLRGPCGHASRPRGRRRR